MKDRVNTGRQPELDVAKVAAILYMVVIHVYEEMSVVNYWVRPDSLFRTVLEFLGGPLAAPVFMFAMGVGMVYTRHRSPRAFALRGLRLLYCFGEYLQTVRDKKTMYGHIALLSLAGLVAISAGMIVLGWNLVDNFALAQDAYYIQRLPGTLWTLCVIGIQLYVCFHISQRLPKPLADGAVFISRRLNTIYLIQWVVIPYSLAVMSAFGLPMLEALEMKKPRTVRGFFNDYSSAYLKRSWAN